jgi:hypothetical protein
VSSWFETNCVGRLNALHTTTEPETKFAPVTVKVKPGPPRVALVGAIAVIVGAGRGEVAEPPQPISRHIKNKAATNALLSLTSLQIRTKPPV